MIGRIVMILLPVLSLLGGAVGGEVLRGPAAVAVPAAEAPETDGPEGEAAPVEAAAHDAPAEGHGGGEEGEASGAGSFRFPDQFFVPLVRNGEVSAMMILTLSLEMPTPAEEAVQARENQLRDSLLRQLLIHANTGGFDGNFTADAHIALLREELLESARRVSPEVEQVLIGDIAKQAG